MMKLQLDLGGAANAAATVGATQKQFEVATRGALTKTAQDALKIVKQQVSAKTKVSQKRLGVRIKMRRYQNDDSVILWVGANPIPLHTIGTPRENTRSVVAGRVTRRGAFLATIGQEKREWALIRENSSHYAPELYGGVSYGEGSGWRGDKGLHGSFKGRFPIRLAVVNIHDAVDEALYDLEVKADDIFEQHFNRLLMENMRSTA